MIASKCTFTLCASLLSILQAMIPFSVSVAYLIGFIVNVILYSNNKFHNPYDLFFLSQELFHVYYYFLVYCSSQSSLDGWWVQFKNLLAFIWYSHGALRNRKRKTVNSNSYLVLSKGMLSLLGIYHVIL